MPARSTIGFDGGLAHGPRSLVRMVTSATIFPTASRLWRNRAGCSCATAASAKCGTHSCPAAAPQHGGIDIIDLTVWHNNGYARYAIVGFSHCCDNAQQHRPVWCDDQIVGSVSPSLRFFGPPPTPISAHARPLVSEVAPPQPAHREPVTACQPQHARRQAPACRSSDGSTVRPRLALISGTSGSE
jgi:hypothetical protein